MQSTISIANAVDRRGCDFTGCETCPFRVYAQARYACMCAEGPSMLLALPFVARLLGQDETRARALVDMIDNELEQARDPDTGQEYFVANVEETKELSERLDEASRGLENVVFGPLDEVRPEWVARVRADLEHWIDPWPVPEGRGPQLSLLLANLRVLLRFFSAAVKMGAGVEFGRYWDILENR